MGGLPNPGTSSRLSLGDAWNKKARVERATWMVLEFNGC